MMTAPAFRPELNLMNLLQHRAGEGLYLEPILTARHISDKEAW